MLRHSRDVTPDGSTQQRIQVSLHVVSGRASTSRTEPRYPQPKIALSKPRRPSGDYRGVLASEYRPAMPRRERHILERAVHVVTEQAAKADAISRGGDRRRATAGPIRLSPTPGCFAWSY